MLETVAWIGVLFLLLETGLEVDFSTAWRQRGDALKIALTDIVVPLAVAFAASLFLPNRYLVEPDHRVAFALFMAHGHGDQRHARRGPDPARPESLQDRSGLSHPVGDVGQRHHRLAALYAGAGLLHAGRLGGIARSLIILAGTIGFGVFCLTIGRRLASAAVLEIRRREMPQPGAALTFIVLLGVLCGAITQWIGINALFGFFLAGIMAGEARELSERTRQIISQMVYAVFVPLFFAGIGLKIDFLTHFDWLLVVFVIVIGIGGRYAGAWLGVSFTQLPRSNRATIAVAHTPGGAMEIIVGLLALEYGLITQAVFVAIVFGALFSSVILGPWLNYVISRRKEVGILEYLSKGSILADLKGTARDQALRELSELAAAQERVHEAEDIYAAVLAREQRDGHGPGGGAWPFRTHDFRGCRGRSSSLAGPAPGSRTGTLRTASIPISSSWSWRPRTAMPKSRFWAISYERCRSRRSASSCSKRTIRMRSGPSSQRRSPRSMSSERAGGNRSNLPCDGRGEQEPEKQHLQLSCKYCRLHRGIWSAAEGRLCFDQGRGP